jgi:peptidoglycan/LPS O-acetylase OafA/YrhL
MKNLDLLRAVAVLCVFSHHLVESLGLYNPGSLGRFGVIIFFVHTSLVLMGSLDRLEKSGLTNKWRLSGAFYIRRLFRIYPLAMFIVLLTPLFHIPVRPLDTYHWVGTRAFLSNLALTENLTYSPDVLGPLWSLPLEVQMYCMLPLAYFVVRKGKYRSLALWILSLVLALTIPRISGRFSVFSFAPCFTSGIVAYDLMRHSGRRMPAWTFPIAILAILIAFGPLDNIGLSLHGKLPRAWGLSLALALVISRVQDGALLAIRPAAHWIAEHSYGIYLSHIVIFWLALNVMKFSNPWLKFLIIAAGSVGVPALLYAFIEKPFITVGVRIAKLMRPPCVVPSPTNAHDQFDDRQEAIRH